MKYRVINLNDTEFSVVTEEGGFANVYHNGENYVTEYCYDKLGSGYDWLDSKMYYRDWNKNAGIYTIIKDALEWLNSEVEEWTIDDTIHSDIVGLNQ